MICDYYHSQSLTICNVSEPCKVWNNSLKCQLLVSSLAKASPPLPPSPNPKKGFSLAGFRVNAKITHCLPFCVSPLVFSSVVVDLARAHKAALPLQLSTVIRHKCCCQSHTASRAHHHPSSRLTYLITEIYGGTFCVKDA